MKNNKKTLLENQEELTKGTQVGGESNQHTNKQVYVLESTHKIIK